MRVVVTGGRNFGQLTGSVLDKTPEEVNTIYQQQKLVFKVLDELNTGQEGPIKVLATGGASGADHTAHSWAVDNLVQTASFPVTAKKWQYVGPKAGPIRNGIMLDTVRPDVVVAFPGGKGTADCKRQAVSKGYRVMEVDSEV